VFVNHKHIKVICVCDAQIFGPKINFVFVNRKHIINLWLDFRWREMGGGLLHTNRPSNATIFVHSSAGRAAAVAGAAAAAAKLLPRTAMVAMKTPAATAMAGAQTTINNQLKAVAATAIETALMRATTTNENKANNGNSGSLAAVRRWWRR
jgi:hypothetical protein